MKILITGATGYIGSAIASAFARAGHDVSGLARSERAASKLNNAGFGVVNGDFDNVDRLPAAVRPFDAVISAASVGSLNGDQATFEKDRDAVRALLSGIEGSGKALLFTSGSAVVGTFAGGRASDVVYDETTVLPLPEVVFAPPSLGVHPMIIEGFGGAMKARMETEASVLQTPGIKGIVVRPGLVYGAGGSYDLPQLISAARRLGFTPRYGSGETLQGFVHIDELAELYRLAVERAPSGATLHGVTAEISQRDLTDAINRMIGAHKDSASFTLEEMLQAAGSAGISVSLNKRLSSEWTRQVTGWRPARMDILKDVEFGSYAP